MKEDGFDLSAKNLFVEFEGFFAIAVEREVRVDLHGQLLFELLVVSP